MPPSIPFVVGQWVRGDRFYGRAQLVSEIIEGHRDSIWLLGTRRIGKTSLLKEIERRAWEDTGSRFFPLFWDFQGSQDAAELHEEFLDSLVDVEEHLKRLGINPSDIEGSDLFRSLGNLRRQLRAGGYRLLLLCDEAEALITLGESDPNLLGKLRRFMQSKEDVRAVLASTLRLWALAQDPGVTSPFLHEFAPPLYISGLSDRQARHLIRQTQLPVDARSGIDEDLVEQIRVRCDNHPYLLQLVSKRFLESGSLEETLEQVATDPMVSHFFAVDFEMLSPAEREVIRILAVTGSVDSESIERRMDLDSMPLRGILQRLENLGYVHRNERRELEIVNYFFRRWFEQQPNLHHTLMVAPASPLVTPPLTMPQAVAPADDPPTTVVFRAEDAENLQPGDKIGKFEIVEKIGRGGFGSVYKGLDNILGRPVAIKIGSAEKDQHQQRFVREARIAASLRHANIVTIHDFGYQGRLPYLVQEYLPGKDLSQVIREGEDHPLDLALGYLLQIAQGMVYAHAQGVIHRDLKPANIRIVDQGIKIMDFGLAKDLASEESLTGTAVTMGTLPYLPPEMIEHGEVDQRSDIFSYGVLSYELLTGQRPFQGPTFAAVAYEIINKDPISMGHLAPNCPPTLQALVHKCMAKEQIQRFSSFIKVVEGLESVRAKPQAASRSVMRLDLDERLGRTQITPRRIPRPAAAESKGVGRLNHGRQGPGRLGQWWQRLFGGNRR